MVYRMNVTDKCPHCGVVNRFEKAVSPRNEEFDIINFVSEDKKETKSILRNGMQLNIENNYSCLILCKCTNCGKMVLTFNNQMLYPLGHSRPKAPQEVPQKIAEDYDEACKVEPLSHKASAALGRRCLQHMLHDQKIKKSDLSKEIDEAMKSLPTHLKEGIDAIRNIGNFSAHPGKSKVTGEIIDVEPGEAEWTLEMIHELFDFYYVQPAITKNKRAALNSKLKDAGRKPMK